MKVSRVIFILHTTLDCSGRECACAGPVHDQAAGRVGGAGARRGVRRPRRHRGGPLPRGRHRGRRPQRPRHLPQRRRPQAGGQQCATVRSAGGAPRDVRDLRLSHRPRLQRYP